MSSSGELATWQFDVSRTKLSSKFMAGRGQVLLQALNWPLQAQEFAKRKKLQEILSKGMLKLDQGNTPLNFISKGPNNQELKSPRNNLSSVYLSEQSPTQHQEQAMFTTRQQQAQAMFTTRQQQAQAMFATAAPVETWSHKEDQNQFSNASLTENSQTMKQLSQDTISSSERYNSQHNIVPKDFERINAAKPLRKPDKSKKKQLTVADKTASAIQNKNEDQGHPFINNQNNKTTTKDWLDWGNNVIVSESVAEEDLPEMVTVGDNDDIYDVVVNQYIDSLQNNHHNGATPTDENRTLTPQRVQQFSKLKSTNNADCTRVLPGTQPNPPKGDDRWGGSELNSNVGWGEPAGKDDRNTYDDGSSLWSDGGSQYGGMTWSKSC